MVVGLTGLAQPAAADPIPTLPILLQVPDHRHVPLNIVTRAADEVVRIYRDAASMSSGSTQGNRPQIRSGIALSKFPADVRQTDR
jgi:hypothetical protein